MPNSNGSMHLLLYCSSADAQTRFAALFNLTGMSVRQAGDAEQFVAQLARHPVDVALLVAAGDGRDALDILRRLRVEAAEQRDTPAVVVFPQDTPVEQASEALRAGAFDYIIEPFSDIELLVKLTMLSRLQTASDDFRNVAVRDRLTGLYDRRYLELRVTEEASRAARYRVSLTVMVVDVDNLSELNKQLGAEAGDRILVGVAEQLNQLKRQSDVLARLGGDEFALVLYNSALSGAVVLADRIRKALSEMRLPGGEGRLLNVSIGLASREGTADLDAPGLLAQAEAAARDARAGGGERKISYG
jgi:diguanylate cyclase (GGDEF)-like protein